jgi:hypothetical protein
VAELVAAGVDLVLTGHVHNPFVLPLNGSGPGGWAIGAGTLSRRLRGTPASFTTIVVDEVGGQSGGEAEYEIVAQGWTGAHFEPLRIWRVPGRRGRSTP